MFKTASAHFAISEADRPKRSVAWTTDTDSPQETKSRQDSKNRRQDSKNRPPKKLLETGAVLKHVRQVRKQMEEKWQNFEPQAPQLVRRRLFDVENEDWIEEDVMVQLDTNPFGHGAIRECFRMKEVRIETRPISHSGQDSSPSAASPSAASASGASPSGSGSPTSPGGSRRRSTFVGLINSVVELKHTERRSIWVAKRSMEGYGDIEGHKRDCEVDVMHQMLAKHYSEEFNTAVRSRARQTGMGRCGAHDMDFLMTHVIETSEGYTFGVEAFIFGQYKKHNNNSGGTMGCRTTPQAFSYFTFIQSNRKCMVVDIQGVEDLYTDPVLHFLPSHATGTFKETDSAVNLGIKGFALFLWSHRYNDIDRLLGLPMFQLSPHEQQKLPPMTNATVKTLAQFGAKGSLNQDEDDENEEVLDIQIELGSVPGINFNPSAWKPSVDAVRMGRKVKAVPLELVEAACHMEIACMYDDHRLAQHGTLSQEEIESAAFHVAQASRLGLPEGSLALARLAADMPHEDFLPEIKGSEKHSELCLTLLLRAGSQGATDALGAWARLVLDGGRKVSMEEANLAVENLEAFAKARLAEAEEGGDEEANCHEVTSKHNCGFGWEDHGFEPHSALARAAELLESQLRKEPGARAKAKELWAAAADCAMEDPCLAKQAMRYTERAEAEDEEEPESVEDCGSPDADCEGTDIKLKPECAQKFLSFASNFASLEDAMEELLRASAAQKAEAESKSKSGSAPNSPLPAKLKSAAVDDDIWAMMG
eukprot:TRINITY_DN23116_c0_g3_i1.p1 TRINITY_DN23116_c0_g3~~TRINITY_DN23116_c0_g3_i1.p1  ORF type:complete len:763 (+),score=159.00 TRINITY_DN23116_c0_g3_i1:129-2417(+)